MNLTSRLEARFDEESVNSALRQIESNEHTVSDTRVISALLAGRGAASRWPRIELNLKKKPDLQTVSTLFDYLPRPEAQKLLDQLAVSDEDLISTVTEGSFPPIGIFPKARREKIFAKLRQLVKRDPDSVEASKILQYLLMFDKTTMRGHLANADSIQLAADWCLQFSQCEKVMPVLSSVIRMKQDEWLLRIGSSHILNSQWTLDTTFLLMALMDVTKSKQDPRWIKRFLRQPKSIHSDFVISAWIRSTNCCPRALAFAKRTARHNYPRCRDTIVALSYFSNRKDIARWLKRFLEGHKNGNFVSGLQFGLFFDNTPLHVRRLFEQTLTPELLQEVDEGCRYRAMIALLARMPCKAVVEQAQKLALAHPNAPNSFHLMCKIAKHNPSMAVPWIAEWIESAMPEEKTLGLCSIMSACAETNYLSQARDWAKTVENGRLAVSSWRRAWLLLSVLNAEPPTSEMIELARGLLKSADESHPKVKELSMLRTNRSERQSL